MRVYKVTIEKIVYLEADNKEDAKERAYDGGIFMMEEEEVKRVDVSSKREMNQWRFRSMMEGKENG